MPSDTTYLDGVCDQNALLMRMRLAAATPGPLLIYLSGRLTADRRSRQLHLAMTGTTTSTVRYTALPWQWLGTELRHRPAGLTTVLLDLAADKGAWPLLQEYGAMPAATSAEVYGVVAPPGCPGSRGVSPYTRAWIEQLRLASPRPTNSRLHALTIGHAALPPGIIVPASTPQITGPAIAAPHTTQQGAARPSTTNVQRILAGDTAFIKQLRRAADRPEQTSPQQSFPLAPGKPGVPAPIQQPAQPPAPQQPQPPAPSAKTAPPARPDAQQASPRPAQDDRGQWVLPSHEQHDDAHHPARAPHPEPQQPAAQPHVPQQTRSAVQQQPIQQAPPTAPAQPDPRPHIYALAQARRFDEATQLAQAWERYVLQTYGIASPQATHCVEIRADLAKQQDDYTLATQLWISAGRTRLVHQTPDAPEVLATGQSAHYCWTQISDPRQARECGPELIALLRALPALDRRHLSIAQQRLEFLNNTTTGH